MLLVANVLVLLVSGAFCLIAVVRPERLLGTDDGPVGPATRFYARFYAVRQLPLSIVVVVAVLAGDRSGLLLLLTVAGTAQAGDAVLAVTRRYAQMTLGAAAAAVLHLGSVVVIGLNG